MLASLATLKYLSYTDDLEQFFIDAVDHYLFRLVFGQPLLQAPDAAPLIADVPMMAGMGMPAGFEAIHEAIHRPQLVAAVG